MAQSYSYTTIGEATVTFDNKSNPAKVTITGIKNTSATNTANAIAGYMYLGGQSMYEEYDVTEATKTNKQGFEVA